MTKPETPTEPRRLTAHAPYRLANRSKFAVELVQARPLGDTPNAISDSFEGPRRLIDGADYEGEIKFGH